MENKMISDLEQQSDDIDIDSMKLDAVIQLKTWQKKMNSLVEKVYLTRLNEIDQITSNLTDENKSDIIIEPKIPKNFQQIIEQTIRVQCDTNDEEEDDDLVIIDIEQDEDKSDEHMVVILPSKNSESRVSKILHSEPVQQALAVTLTNTLTHMGTLAVTSGTTVAATTIAKTALLTTASGLGTVAFGMGKIALGATQKAWSLMSSAHQL